MRTPEIESSQLTHDAAFAAAAEYYRRELQLHCYRMLGSFDESEDLVQETYLRAWRHRAGFAGRSTLRTWLYRIATNACLDFLKGRPRRVLPNQLVPPWQPETDPAIRPDLPWLQPYPDRLLDPIAPRDDEPDAAAVARETIELTFLAAIQHLPPRQRAVLILRDVLDWPAAQVAALLDTSVASVNSALQRARATLKTHLPPRRSEWKPSVDPTEGELALLRRYIDAVERADVAAVAVLLRADAVATMPPYPFWFAGRDAIAGALSQSLVPSAPDYIGQLRFLPIRANRQPAAAAYVRAPGESEYRRFALGVLRIEDDRIAELTAFHDEGLFAAFDLPLTL